MIIKAIILTLALSSCATIQTQGVNHDGILWACQHNKIRMTCVNTQVPSRYVRERQQ